MEKFEIYNSKNEKEYKEWTRIVETDFEDELMLKPAYLNLFCRENQEGYCVYLKDNEHAVLYPFLLREIPFAPEFKDIITAYGYGGPFVKGKLELEKISTFWNKTDEWLMKNKVVSEVVKFSLFGTEHCGYPGMIEEAMKNIVRELNMPMEDMWMEFEHKVRKNLKKAQKNDLEFRVDPKGEYLEQFLEIYYSTMERREAGEAYYFEPDFFRNLQKNLPENFCYFHIFMNGRMISTELALMSQSTMYSYLGGTIREYFEYRPNDFLKYQMILWAKEKNLKRFVLGGGYQNEDGIYKYKRSFAPNGEKIFKVGTRILNQEAYEQLCQMKGIDAKHPFVPAYRIEL
ncbi:GNAT family N-acetyltransferase [Anaerosacchariphilus polymeriproducens]|uniref:GNAT family N-acetyltransferase n=1 Tax=Anaerosacchariphilus polymeriproducens TaxID=1812858 RepID=UPI0013904AA1|nr:GNAT family N-acetyltransferase [Anaerosacchariphilus polymeriproducens]